MKIKHFINVQDVHRYIVMIVIYSYMKHYTIVLGVKCYRFIIKNNNFDLKGKID